MLTPTHLAAAHAAYLGACVMTAHAPSPGEALVALGAAMIPDLDSPQSYSGRVLPPVSAWLERTFGHRTITHALLPQAAIGMLAWWLLPPGFALALIAGWVSHSFTDMMLPSGVCWFWPSRIRCVLPGNPRYRIQSMSGGEFGFLLVMALACVLLMPLAATGKGSAGLIRAALGDLEAARAEYDRDKGSWAFDLEVKGRNNATFADISGRYPVRGPWRDTGLILDSANGPVSLCTGSACDWYADHAALERTIRQDTTATPVEAPILTVGALVERVRPLTAKGDVYLLGSALVGPGVKPDPPALEVNGEVLRFVYASPAVLDQLATRTLREVELTVQIRHSPDTVVAAPEAPAAAPREVHPLLRRYWVSP